MHTFTR